jgi:AraC-like DNA-binding protein
VNEDDAAPLAGLATEERLRAGDLIAELNARARKIGLNSTDWPGLSVYRFECPVVPQRSEVHALSLCVIAQGRKAVTIDGSTYRYDPFNYLVLRRGMRFEAEIVEASVEKPFLSFVLQIDPAIVRRIYADLNEHTTTAFRRPASRSSPGKRAAPARVTPLDADTAGAVSGSCGPLHSAPTGGCWHRCTFRRSSTECCRPSSGGSSSKRPPPSRRTTRSPGPSATSTAHLADQLAVADLAENACLSPSAFAHLFRDVTGMSPYQFIKSARMDQARKFLVDADMNVSEIARAVGYSSLSHFVNEFKHHFESRPVLMPTANATSSRSG